MLGFLRYNFHPASIFMGDSGSLFVGFILAATALQTHEKSTTAVALLVPIVALGLPIGDTLLAMTRRMVRGQPVFASDAGHIHHRLMARGLSHRATVLALYGIAVVLGAIAVALFHSDAEQTVAFVGAIVAIAVMLLVTAGYVPYNRTRQLFSDRKNNLAMRAAVRRAGEQLRLAEDADAIWRVVQETVPELQASCAALTVVARNGTVKTSEYSWGFDDAPHERAAGPVQPARRAAGRRAARAGVHGRPAHRGPGHGDLHRAPVRARVRGGAADRGAERGGDDGSQEAAPVQEVGASAAG